MTSLIQTVLLFLAAALVVVPLSNRLGLGSVLGYLLAGVFVGLSGIGHHSAEETLHFAELGVIFLLFMIGLEIRPAKLLGMRRRLLGLGLAQIVLCGAVLTTIVSLALGTTLVVSFVIGFSLSLSSTAFALQTMEERNELHTVPGQGAFAILLMQDLMAIPLLALIPVLFGTGKSSANLLWYFPLILIGLFLMSRYVLRPLFRILADSRSREIFTAVTLFIVLGVALLMMGIGLSAALGTFIAGVLLAESEYRHELEANLDPFKGLLMGLFFMAVGMSVDVGLILERPFLLLAGTVGYFLLKWTLIYIVGRLNRMNHPESVHMGFQIAQGGEFAFVILALTQGEGIIAAEDSKILVALITLSMLFGPLLEKLLQKIRTPSVEVEPKFDDIPTSTAGIIIGGYGRFGQMFGRILRSQGIPFVAIDHDSQQVDLVRRFGNKVFYGDITRLDLLHAAGAEKARYLVLAVDDVELSLKAAALVRKHFPHIKIFARARNRGHAFELLELGIDKIKRETFDSSVNFVGDLLQDMGLSADRSHMIVEKFRRHDEAMLLEQSKVRKDEARFIDVSTQGAAQLEEVLKEESAKTYL